MQEPWPESKLLALMRNIESARTENELMLYAEQCKTAPELEKETLRKLYTARLKMIRQADELGFDGGSCP